MRYKATSIGPLLDCEAPPQDASEATTAVFYSISSCQDGLRGISFGNFLIKQVVSDLLIEQPQLKTFVTLSPVPRFRAWLTTLLRDNDPELDPKLIEQLGALDEPTWYRQDELANSLKDPLLKLCARFLLEGTGNSEWSRPGRSLSPRERGQHRADQLARRHFRHADGSICRHHGELLLPLLTDRDEPRELSKPTCARSYVNKGKIAASGSVRDLWRKK